MFVDVSKQELEDELFLEAVDHYNAMKAELGMVSQWDIHAGNGVFAADDCLLQSDKQYKVTYTYIDSMGDTMDDVQWAEVSMFAPSGSIKDLWFAADSCIRQSGTHHSYIEDFEMQEDGTLALVTGS
jgi:hypothetical protein